MGRPVDAELIARCLAGSDDAWAELVERYSGFIYSIALKYGLSADDAAEVFQSVCLQWWQSLDRIQDLDRLTGWLATVTGRAAWRVIEQRRRDRQHLSGGDDDALELPGREPLPEELLLAGERNHTLHAAVQALGGRCRDLVMLLFFTPDPPNYAAIADRFGLAEGSIGALRQRCLSRLRAALEIGAGSGAFFGGRRPTREGDSTGKRTR